MTDPKTRRLRWVLALAAVLLVTAVAGGWLFYRTQVGWLESPAYERSSSEPSRTLVVVYSRTGNTLSVAKVVARRFDADLLRIEAPQYGRNLEGGLLAGQDADEEVVTTPIEHLPVEPSRYELVILCSPTWWYRPAPPLWSFVENHDFTGASVFLLMTGNSRLTEERAGKFGPWVEQRGGTFLGRAFIRRGRVYWQRSTSQVHDEAQALIEELSDAWPVQPE
jgi:flavodoxin